MIRGGNGFTRKVESLEDIISFDISNRVKKKSEHHYSLTIYNAHFKDLDYGMMMRASTDRLCLRIVNVIWAVTLTGKISNTDPNLNALSARHSYPIPPVS